MPTRKPAKGSRSRSKTKAQRARASRGKAGRGLSKSNGSTKGVKKTTARAHNGGGRAVQASVPRHPRGSPPASAFPKMRAQNFAPEKLFSSEEDDDAQESESGSSEWETGSSEWETATESEDDGEESSGSTNHSESLDLKDAALLLMSVSPRLTARPRSMSDFGAERPLESLAGLAELGGAAAIGSAGVVHTSYRLNQGYRLSAHGMATSAPQGSSVFAAMPGSGPARPRRMSEIDKLHACLSGLSRTASFGSLSSFQSDRSLFSAVAPYPLSRDASSTTAGQASAPGGQKRARSVVSKKRSKKRPRSKASVTKAANQKQKKRRRKKKKPNSSKAKNSQGTSATSQHPTGPINPDCPADLRSKYGTVYNMNGRVGIYTPQQRLALLAKFRQKRTSRVWRKTVRYNCRKNLADSRLRIKGRFVRRDSEEAKAYFAKLKAELDQKTANIVKTDGGAAAGAAGPTKPVDKKVTAVAAATRIPATPDKPIVSTTATITTGTTNSSSTTIPSNAPTTTGTLAVAEPNSKKDAIGAAPSISSAPTAAAADGTTSNATAAPAPPAEVEAATAPAAAPAPASMPAALPQSVDASKPTGSTAAEASAPPMQGSATVLSASIMGRRPRSISSIF